MSRPFAVLIVVLLGTALGCNGDGVTNQTDVIPPSITIVEPASRAVVNSERPRFVIELEDNRSGVFCSSVDADIDGIDFSGSFRNGCDEQAGEVVVQQGRLLQPLATGRDHTLVFSISDNAGNEATATTTFSVDVTAPPPPAPN